MEIIIKRKDFIEALDKISGVIGAKPAITSLSGILIEGKEDEIVLTATDLENTIKTSLKGKINKKGTALIPGRKLISLVKQLGEEDVKLFLKETQIHIQSENSTYNFFGMNPDDFPKIPKFSGGTTVKLNAMVFKQAIDRAKFCIYPEEPRPHFRGGLLEIKNGALFFVATDTRRLAMVKSDIQTGGEAIKCLLPYKLLNFLSDILREGEIEISVGKNQAFFKFNETYLISQLLEGSADFPDYEKVVPDEKKMKVVKLDTTIFQATLRRIALFTSDRYNKVKFNFTKGRLTISVSSPDVGEAQERLSVPYDGEEQGVAFNPDYILEFLQKVEDEAVLFGFTTETRPVLMRPEKDSGYLYVAMPLKYD